MQSPTHPIVAGLQNSASRSQALSSDPARESDENFESRPAVRRAPWAIVLIIAALLPSTVWIARDHTPWPWDQAWYGEVSVDLWFYLTHSWLGWVTTMLTGINTKPPGIVWLGQFFVPLGAAFGSIEKALLLLVLLTQAVTLYLIFRIGRGIAPGSNMIAPLGVCMAAATQSFVGLSHQFFVEPLQALSVAWIVLVAVRCAEWPSARIVLQAGAALVLGVLAKATTPVYCFVPCLYIGVILIRRPLGQGWKDELRRPLVRVIAGFTAITLPLTLLWYAVNLKAAWQHVRDSSSGGIALHYGFHAPLGQKVIVWLGLMDQSFLSPYLGWVVILAAIIGIAARFRSRSKRALPPGVGAAAVACGIQCGLLLVMFSLNDAVDARYMYPMLTLIAAIAMAACAPIQSRKAFAVMFSICALQFAVVNLVALGKAAPLSNQFGWLIKPSEDPGRFHDVESVVRMTSAVAGRNNIVGVEEPWLNANTASFFAAKHRLETGTRSYFSSLGYAEKDLKSAEKRVDELNPMYFITLKEAFQTNPPDFLNAVSLPMLERVRTDTRFTEVATASPTGVLVFRRH